MLKKLIAICTAFTLVGCATHSATYNENNSLALNLANAAKIDGVKDTKVDKQDYAKITGGNILIDGGWVAGNVMNPGMFSSGGALGLSLLTLLSERSAARDHQLVGWMPDGMAEGKEQAYIKLAEIVSDAINNALEELEIKQEIDDRRLWHGSFRFNRTIKKANWGCLPNQEEDKRCVVKASIGNLVKEDYPAPEFIGEYNSYFFPNGSSEIKISAPNDSTIDAVLLYSSISKYLPEWMFMYVPPARNIRPRRDYNPPMPIIYYKGKPEFFVIPE